MRRSLFVILTASLALLGTLSAGVYAYDHSRAGTLAPGIRIAGLEVGGLDALAAEERVRQTVFDGLDDGVVVKAAGRRYRLSAEQARVAVDIRGTVDDALDRTRRGSLVTRTRDALAGRRLDLDLAPTVTYDREAVARLVERIERRVTRAPVEAGLRYATTALAVQKGRDGRALRSPARLRRSIARRLTDLDPAAPHTVTARTIAVRPQTSTAQLAERFPVVLTVDRATNRLRLWKGLQLAKIYTISVGTQGYETPTGLYTIQDKQIDPVWHVPDREWAGKLRGKTVPGGTKENPLKARWMGFYDGAGIHGTSAEGQLGRAASHGCVRMRVADVKELFEQVPVGAPIYIA